ncbi:diacylglycerol kinase [Candidatus Omnitrophota bacterium]
MKKQNIVRSFNSAIEGFLHAVRTQRNMRLHFLIGIIALIMGVYVNLEKTEILLLLMTICFVMFAEMLNTAIEMTADLISDSFNPQVRAIKDIGAACVLISAINAFIVGYLLFLSRILGIRIESGIDKIRSQPWHLTFMILLAVLFLVILSKAVLHKGTPLRGGMPSGHAALAFAIWATVTFLTANNLVMLLVFILAALVARSRMSGKVHTIWEVLLGSALGVLIPTIIFQVLR